MFDIEQRRSTKGREHDMDALTSFELEAQRRRETVASDRDRAWARANASTGSVDVEFTPMAAIPATRSRAGRAAQGDCQPAPLARQSVG
jgi:hypothetical protein